jgi:hypothetical protein
MITPPFPLPPPQYDTGFLARVMETIRVSFMGTIGKTEAVESVLLQAPDGSVWKVTVSNAGTLTTTVVPLASR